MTKEEFDTFLNECGLSNSEAAEWFSKLAGTKTTSRYIANLRNGNQPVSKAVVIFCLYVREKYECDALKETISEMRALINTGKKQDV